MQRLPQAPAQTPAHASFDPAAAFARLSLGSFPQSPEPDAPAPLPEWTLDQIGAENEEIKNRCIDLVRTIEGLAQVKQGFVEISNWIGHILAAREETNAAIVERGMMIAMLEGSLADLRDDNRSLHEGREEARAENSLLASENERLRAIVHLDEGRIEKLNADLRAAQEALSSYQEAYEAERAQAHHLRGEVEDLQEIVAGNDALVAQLQRELAGTQDETVLLRQRAETLQASLTEAQAAWGVDSEENRRRVAELETRLQEQTSRAQAAEGLLVEARGALQEKTEQYRLSERQAAEMEQKLLRLSEHAEAAASDAAAVKERLDARDRAHARLSKRARALIRALRDLASRLEKAEQRAALANERVAAEAGRFAEQRARLEQSLHERAEQLEKERAANQVTAGALDAARRELLSRREADSPAEPQRVIDLLARAEKTLAASERSRAGDRLGLATPQAPISA